MKLATVAVVLAVVSGCGVLEDPAEQDLGSESVEVVDVVDGDTIEVRTAAGDLETVRLLGIDTPEAAPPAECWAGEATTALTQALTREGSDVQLVTDPMADDRDVYDRLLRYVDVDQVDVGLQLVTAGHADLYRDGEGITRTADYVDAQQQAQQADAGLWGACR